MEVQGGVCAALELRQVGLDSLCVQVHFSWGVLRNDVHIHGRVSIGI